METWNSLPKVVQLALTQQKAKGRYASAVTNSAKKVKMNHNQSMKGESNEDNSFNKDKANAKARKNVSQEFSQNVSHGKPIERHNKPETPVKRQSSGDMPVPPKRGKA